MATFVTRKAASRGDDHNHPGDVLSRPVNKNEVPFALYTCLDPIKEASL